MKPRFLSPGFPFAIRTALIFTTTIAPSIAAIWDNTAGTSLWSTPTNWDPDVEPTSTADVLFPAGLAGTITLASGENAKSLQFDDAYTLTGGGLMLASASSIGVANGVTATIVSPVVLTDGSTKTGPGTLVLSGSNTNATGVVIDGGRLRVTLAASLTTGGATVNAGTFLEVANNITLNVPIALNDGGTVSSIGSPTNTGILTINPAATAVALATDSLSDALIIGNGTNDVTGGSASTVINIGGPGAVRLNSASNFAGSWNIPSGRLEVVANAALGNGATSVTLSGGSLVGRLNSALVVTGPGSNLLLTANSSILSDRTAGSNGAGVNHTFGTLSMGTHTLTVAPGVNPNSGTAGITLGSLSLTGNPGLAVDDNGVVNGKLTTGSLLGGGIARTITKTGAGDLAVTGGTTDLISGSAFSATGGGTIEMLFPNPGVLGVLTPVAITEAQNPFGSASISVTDGALRLLATGANTTAAQSFQLTSAITLGGDVTLDPDRRPATGSTKTFELPGLTLASGTALSMSGDNLYGVRVTGPLVLQGNATLKGIDTASKDGLLTLDGGISGGPSTVLSTAGGTSPLNLTINASGTYGGGTLMGGSNVTLNAVNALGTGPLTQTGGTLIVNTDNALVGTLNLNGGTLRVNDTNALASNPILLNGGILDFRNNTTAVITTGALTVSGNSGFSLGNNGSGSSQVFDFPEFNVSGDTTLTVTPLSSYVPNLLSVVLSGNLTLAPTGTLRVQSITEFGSPRTLIKSGTGTLELEGANFHTGGTEVIAGVLLVELNGALGGGTLTLGNTTGTDTAIARFNTGLVIPNDLATRAGTSGILTFDAPNGGVTWNGNLSLQNAVTFANNNSTVPSFINGLVSGSGNFTKSNTLGEIVLANASNSFLGGITIAGGTLTVASDSALGNSANSITFSGTTSALKINGSFATSRTLNFTGTSTAASSGINVTDGNEFTLNSPLTGSGTFNKSGAGIMILPPGLDSSLRGGATSSVSGGILRVQGVKNLSDTGIIALTGTSGTVELLRDSDTTFPHPVSVTGTGVLHVDRAIGGSGTNGRHTLGSLTTTSGNLTVTGANGYGLTLGAATVGGNNTITNNTAAELLLASLGANSSGGSPAVTFGGTGVTRINGAINTSLTNYGITKAGPGTLHFGTSVGGFGRAAIVNDGTLDLNGLNYSVNALTMGGAASALGAQLVTGASGSLVLSGTLTFSNTGTPAGAVFSGNLDLGNASRSFAIGDSAAAPVDLTIDGSISGTAGVAIVKSGTGTLRLSGAGNTQPGLFSSSAGLVELAKSSGDAIGLGGLATTGGIVRLAASEQFNNGAPISLSSANETFLELANFTETVGPLSLTQTDYFDYTAVKTGATGTLVLNGTLTLNNNTSGSSSTARQALITGTGGESTPSTDGTLDLGGVTRTIHVATSIIGVNEPNANATIETRIINGGILKTGPRTLHLTNPNNSFNGGLQIAEGFVRPGTGTSLGLAPVTFTNAPGVPAGIDFGTLTGTLSTPITTGTGSSTFSYAAPAPSALELSGGFNIAGEIVFSVVNGTVVRNNSAVLDVSGIIDDGAGSFGLRKIGNGTLKLAPGNTFGGGTVVERGILAIAADSALGDSTAALILNGGCLVGTASFDLTRQLIVDVNGGSLRVDEIPHTLEVSGHLAWSDGTTAIDGSGRTVISGTTLGPGGNLILGTPIAFATGSTNSNSWGTRVCLQGAATLPAGNLSITNNAVLELGNGNFTRPLGTGPGEVQLPTSQGGGWAAVGADRSVNIGGAGSTLVWGQESPPFLYQPASFGTGSLILGSITATHTVDFQNPLDFVNDGGSYFYRWIVTHDGQAAVDARISGDLGQSASPAEVELELTTYGTLEITGDVLGEVSLYHNGSGRTILSGDNDLPRSLSVSEGTVELATNDSIGTPGYIYIASGAHLDASALTIPVKSSGGNGGGGEGGGNLGIEVEGLLSGNVEVFDFLSGNGFISGSVSAIPSSRVNPYFGGTLHVGSDFTLQTSSWIEFSLEGTVPEVDHTRMRVSGAVNLDGSDFVPYFDSFSFPMNFDGTLVLILNDGSDPINGTFLNLSEGAIIPLFNDPYFRSLQVTYLANGDDGPIGNDFAVTVIGGFGGSPFENWIDTFPALMDPLDKTKDANPDKDTLNNLGEFALDGDPASGAASGKIVGKIALVDGVNTMTLTIPVRDFTNLDPGDPLGGELVLINAADDLTYRIQASDDLSSFDLEVTEVIAPDATDIQNGLSLPPLTPGWIYRTFRSPGPVLGDPAEFMRVQINELDLPAS